MIGGSHVDPFVSLTGSSNQPRSRFPDRAETPDIPARSPSSTNRDNDQQCHIRLRCSSGPRHRLEKRASPAVLSSKQELCFHLPVVSLSAMPSRIRQQ